MHFGGILFMTHSLRLALIASTALAAATPGFGSIMPQTQTQTSPAPATTPDPTPLLAKWPGGHEGVPQWDKVVPAMFAPAFERAMANARADMIKIRDNPAAPTFQNTIEAGQRNGEEMGRLFAVWGVYQSNLATPEVQAIAKEWSPKISAFFTEMSLDPKMFARVKAVYDHRAHAGLNAQQLRLLERSYRDYVTSGALLDETAKAGGQKDQPGARHCLYRIQPQGPRRRGDRDPARQRSRSRRACRQLQGEPRRGSQSARRSRQMGDQEHALLGPALPDVFDQPGAAREGLQGVHRPRRQ
jgi:hypothetical protein